MRRIVIAAFALVAAVTSPASQKKPAQKTAFPLRDAVIVKGKVEKSDMLFALRTAANDLAGVISNLTGVAVGVYDEGKEPEGVPAIHLGDTKAAREAGLRPDDLRLCDWRIKCVPGRAFVFGRSSYAVCGGVFDFAEKCLDYHVLFPDDGPDAFTFNPDAKVPLGSRTVRPAIYNREMYSARFNRGRFPYTMAYWERYGRARMCEPGPSCVESKYRVSTQTKHCHSTFQYLPPEKYFADHPEYYCMGPDGKRHGTKNAKSQLCYTNPDTYRLVRDALFGFIEADRAKSPDEPPMVYDFSQEDNSDFICLCPACRKVIAKYNRVEGGHKEGGDAGLVLEFANRLARDVAAKYPGVQIRIFAYVSTERAPEKGKIEIEPNLRIRWCNVYSKVDATIPLLTKGHFNEENATELKEWTDLTKNVEIWDYLYRGDQPTPAAEAIASNIRFFVSCGIDSIFMENEYWAGAGSWDELNRYLLAKLYIEPKLDVDKLVRTFCRAYGRAADDMYAAYRFLHGEILARPSRTRQEATANMRPWNMDATVMERFAAMVEKACMKEPDDRIRGRMTPLLVKAWGTLLGRYQRDPNAKDKFEKAKQTWRKWALENGRIAFMEPSRRKSVEKDVENQLDLLTLKFDDLPAELKDVPAEEMLLVDWHWRGDGKRVDDPKSPRGKASFVKSGTKLICGCYDRPSKKSYGQRIVKMDEELCADKYTWIRLKQVHVGLETIFWFPGSWSNDFNLKSFHILDDGMEVDPNWYDLWISARYEDGTAYVDRLALRRVAPPQTGK